MKVISFDKILEIKNNIDMNKNFIKERTLSNYETSQKILKLNKKKNILSKINFDINFKPSTELNLETKYKNVIIALNKVNRDNVDEISKELISMKIDDFTVIYKFTDSILKKIMNESNYIQFYLSIINNLSTSRNWCVIFNKKYSINMKEAFILKVQETFESKIENCDKDFGTKLMKLFANLYHLKWIRAEIYFEIVDYLLSKQEESMIYLEYVIIFIKSCSHIDFNEKKNMILNEMKLSSRLRFMLEEE